MLTPGNVDLLSIAIEIYEILRKIAIFLLEKEIYIKRKYTKQFTWKKWNFITKYFYIPRVIDLFWISFFLLAQNYN